MYFLQVIMAKIFDIFHKSPQTTINLPLFIFDSY